MELIHNKGLLGLNSDIDSYKAAKTEAPLEMPLDTTKEEYDVILHYLKLAAIATLNNSADTNNENNENTSPTLQVIPYNRPVCSVNSDNLARSSSFKSFKNIQQSCKGSHSNSYTDEILGTSLEIIENNNLTDNSVKIR